jgi:Domain of unknown function (DUF4352)
MKKRSGLLEALGYILLVVLATLACNGGSSGGAGKGKSKKVKPAKIGATVTHGDSTWKVTKAKDKGATMTCGPFGAKKTSGRFIWVEFEVKNTTKKQESVLELPKLVDSQDREFKQWNETMMCIGKDKKTMSLEQLPAGMDKKFVAVFEVPNDAKKLRFMTRELAFGGETKPVDLGL